MIDNASGLFNFDPSVAEGLSLVCDWFSIGRCVHSVKLIAAGKTAGLGFNLFGVLGGCFIIVNASRLLDKAIVQLKNAKTREMKIFHAVIHVPGELNYLIIGLSMLALKVSLAAKVALSWTPVFYNALMGSFLAMSAIKFIESCYGLSITYTLRDLLEDQGKSEWAPSKGEADGLVDVRMLIVEENQLSETVEESFITKPVDPGELVKIKIEKLKLLADGDLEKLGMQTNKECAQSIKDFDLKNSTPQTRQELLDEVKKANYHANTDYWLLLGVSVVSVAAAGVGLAFTGPLADVVENVLCAIASVAWVNIDATELRNAIKERFWTHHQKSQNGEYTKLEQAEFWTKTAVSIITAPIWVAPALAYYKIAPLVHHFSSDLEKTLFAI
jgi:hypothetical protein